MPETIRFGVIGGGLMGRESVAMTRRWDELLDLDVRPEIVAICDTNETLFDWFRQRLPQLRLATTDYRELLDDPEIDAIYCAVPHYLHADLYCDILATGKHLLAEKPFGIDQPANARIMEAVHAHPDLLVRVSSEFPFFPGAQRIVRAAQENRFGTILEVRSGFYHSSDLDPNKPINWKRMVQLNGEYGCMGDLGLHVVHLPFRFGWRPRNVRALLSNVITQRPDGKGGVAPCDTWDNALLATEVEGQGQRFPMLIETRRIAPGETDTWFLEVLGTEFSISFSTKYPRTLRFMEYHAGEEQSWQSLDLPYRSVYRTVTDGIFEFGFSDALLQMWAAFVDELAHGEARPAGVRQMIGSFRCALPEEAELSHALFTAAIQSEQTASVVPVALVPDQVGLPG